jgi:hypothetical protein
MRSKWVTIIAAALMIISLGLIGVGCGDDEETPNNVVEPTLPLSNERIVDEQLVGTPGQNTSIHMLYDAGARTYFIGRIDGSYTVGEFSSAGQLIWSNPQDDRLRGIFPFPDNDIGLNEGFIYVGGHSTDGDDRVEEARIGLTGAGGVDIDERMFAKTDTTMWFNAVDRIGDLRFVVVGSIMTNGDEYHPYAATFEIEPDSTLTLLNEKVFDSLADRYFVGVEVDPGKVAGDAFTCYTTMEGADAAAESGKQFVGAFHGSTTDVSAYGVDWTVELAWPEPLDMVAYLEGIELYDGSIYVAGNGDITKENGPTSGGYWNAGYIGSVSTTGVLNWFNVVTLSKHSDGYYNVCVMPGGVCAVGVFDSYLTSSTDVHYGLALISVFDRGTGAEIYHLGFGGADYRSGFYTILPSGAHAFCGGVTDYSTSESGYRGWFTEIELDGIGSLGRSSLPVLPKLITAAEDSGFETRSLFDEGRSGGR